MEIINYQPSFLLKWSSRLTLFSLLLFYAIGFRYFIHAALPSDLLGTIYLVTAFMGHFAFLAFSLWLLILAPLSFISPNKKLAQTIISIILLLSIILLFIDTFVFQQYRFHLNLFIWNLILNDKNGEIFYFSTIMKFIATLAIALLIGVYWLASKKISKSINVAFPAKKIWGTLLSLYLVANFIHIYADAQYDQKITRFNQNLPVYYPATAISFMEKQGWVNYEAREANRALTIDSSQNLVNYPLVDLQFSEVDSKYNIIIIAIDSWRADEMNESSSPNIWQMAQNGLYFTNHYSGSNSTRTGIFSLFYGLPGVYWDAMYANKISPVLLSTLLNRGYETGIFASASLDNPEFNRTVFADIKDLRIGSSGSSPIARDRNLTEEWLVWLEDHSKNQPSTPFFGFLFYDAPHGYSIDRGLPAPFQPEADMNYLLLNPDYDATKIRNRYKNSVYQDDYLIGQVIEDLKEKELLDKTIIIITGDHGQEFNDNDHNYWGHGSNFSNAQVKVPFVVHWPGKQPMQVNHSTTHFDVVPTLMKEALGATSDVTTYSSGNNLFSPTDKQWRLAGSYRDFAIIDQNQIIVSGLDGIMRVYDHTMNEIENPTMNMELLSDAMKEMTRFYK